jgi:hypothetical protein
MKHEFEHRYRLSDDVFDDLTISKLFCDKLCLPNEGFISGYVHQLCQDPFGFILLSDIQVFQIVEN